MKSLKLFKFKKTVSHYPLPQSKFFIVKLMVEGPVVFGNQLLVN